MCSTLLPKVVGGSASTVTSSGQPRQRGAEQLHADERVGDERQVRAMLLDGADVDAPPWRCDRAWRWRRSPARCSTPSSGAAGSIRGDRWRCVAGSFFSIGDPPSYAGRRPAGPASRAASAGRTSAQNRRAARASLARRMPGRWGRSRAPRSRARPASRAGVARLLRACRRSRTCSPCAPRA